MAGLIAGSFSKKQIEENRERKRRISLFFFHLLTKCQLKTSPFESLCNGKSTLPKYLIKLIFCVSLSTDFVGNSDKTEVKSDGLYY